MLKSFNKLSLNLKFYLYELIKYDLPKIKFPLSVGIIFLSQIYLLSGKYLKSIKLLSILFRSGWLGSVLIPTIVTRKLFCTNPQKQFLDGFKTELLEDTTPLPHTKKFFDDPKQLFEGVLIVLKESSDTEKGVILLKYSYYFPLLFKLFNVDQIAEKYHIVLEPSWAGFCDPNILIYQTLKHPVFVMTYETRDLNYLQQLNSNLVPVKIGPSWWVDHSVFNTDLKLDRDIDLLVIAQWARFKRHITLFKVFNRLINSGKNLKIVLAGYPGDFDIQHIKYLAELYDLSEHVEIHEWLPPEEVSQLYQRSKINILWSRFEGNNRSIIEGMFCDTPGIIREGHNFGDKYAYINEKTAMWANESTLEKTIIHILENPNTFSPKDWVLGHHNNKIATATLHEIITKKEREYGNVFDGPISLKVNNLHGMSYVDKDDYNRFSKDYDFILECTHAENDS